MLKKKIVIASHALDEAITQCVIKNKRSMDSHFIIVSLRDFISSYDVFDELDDLSHTIRWYNYNGRDEDIISNESHCLLNRVLYVPGHLFSDFASSDKEYASRELEAYLGFAFNAFSGVGNKSAKGICAEILSLPQQWRKIKQVCEINVPNYYWGPEHFNTLDKEDGLVYSSPYNFINWSLCNTLPEEGGEESLFCFEKPQGDPIFILSIGNEQLIYSHIFLSKETEDCVKQFSKIIAQSAGYFISEILFFINESAITFGCINAEIIRSNKNPCFDEFVCKHLTNEFYKCAN
ncbi:MAG: hypothetical protein H0U75_09855 [Legionella sp.]|nr:hypothetical protein [Legionella sp.]